MSTSQRKKIVAVVPYRVSPPVSGGHNAIFYVNEKLSEKYDVNLFSVGRRKGDPFSFKPATLKKSAHFNINHFPGLRYLGCSFFSTSRTGIPPVFANSGMKFLNPRTLLKEIGECDLIQVDFPWQFEWVKKNNINKVPIVLVSHNVEHRLYRKTSSFFLTPWISRRIEALEKFAVENSDAIITFTEADKEKWIRRFNISEDKIRVIPCGVDLSIFRVPSKAEKESAKENLGFPKKKIVFFAGHLWGPNVEAVTEIEKIAKQMPSRNILFLVAGRVGEKFKNRDNVHFTGYVDDISDYFLASDIAVNPMLSGSGMNLKVLDYLASGLPTVTTELGMRGIHADEGEGVVVSDIKDFSTNIQALLQDIQLHETISVKGRKLVEEYFSWKKIALERHRLYETLMDKS